MIFFTENAMELEANSISQMFISAKANSFEGGASSKVEKEERNTIRVYPKMWAPIAGKVGASAAEK